MSENKAPLCQGSFEGICAAYTDLQARLAAAEADAGRYRWLLDNSNIGITERQQVVMYLNPKLYATCDAGDSISAAIDAARGGE